MKNILTIIKEAGVELTEEQSSNISSAVSANYKTIAEVEKLNKKLETAESAKSDLESQLTQATETIKGFEGSMTAEDIEAMKKEYEEKIKAAQEESARGLAERDQRDFLNAKFDELGISSARMRNSLMGDIMGADGLKWKDGKFFGLDEYLQTENERDHFYETEEEKALKEKQEKASAKIPKITEPSKPKTEPAPESVPVIF